MHSTNHDAMLCAKLQVSISTQANHAGKPMMLHFDELKRCWKWCAY